MNPIEDKRPDERLGAYLARAREARGMSAADLATVTHLSEKNVELIEAGDWKAFSIEAYLRSYLNSISNKLGLDQKKVLDWYGAESGTRHASLLNDFAPKSDKASNPLGVEEPKRKNFIIPLIVVIVGLVIVVAAHFVRDVSKATEAAAESAPVKEAVVEEPAEEPAEMPDGAEVVPADSLDGDSSAVKAESADTSAAKKETGLSQAEVDSAVKKSALPASATIFISSTSTEKEELAEEGNAEEAAVEEPAAKGVKTRLELVASGEMRTWIGIKRHEDDDKFLRESNLVKAGTRMVYKATDTVFVVIGEPRAISKMVLNGKTTKIPLAKNARVARFNVYNGKVLK